MTGAVLVVPYDVGVPLEPVDPALIWIQDVAKEYGIPYRTLHRWIQKGGLGKYRRVGDRRRYLKRSELDELLRFHRVPPKEEG